MDSPPLPDGTPPEVMPLPSLHPMAASADDRSQRRENAIMQEALEAVYALVAAEMRATDERLTELITTNIPQICAISAELCDSDGKRLRPLLTALGCRVVGFNRHVPDLMCIAELIHVASLLHDDVVDDAQLRRGRPAAHRVYGNAAVILTGDYCLGRAISSAAEVGQAVVKSLALTITEMAEGEVLQLQSVGHLETSRDEYLQAIDKKSGALFAWCVSVGARVTGNVEVAIRLEHFGRQIGAGFQIADDVLDYESSASSIAGQDLQERKVTLPLLIAMTRIPGLRDRVETATDEDILSLVTEVRSSGALEDSLAEARAHVAAGITALDDLPMSDAHDALIAVAQYLVNRRV